MSWILKTDGMRVRLPSHLGYMCPAPTHGCEFDDAFQLHWAVGTRRCVVWYDDLEEALEGAFNRLKEDQTRGVWISDAQKRVVLDAGQIRARLAQRVSPD